jgi:hypothetical protein
METDLSVSTSFKLDLESVRTVPNSSKSCAQLTPTTAAQSTTLVSLVLSLKLYVAEFLAATMEATTFLKEQYLKSAFKMFDTDGSGKIDSVEIGRLLSGEEFKDVYTTDQLNEAIKEVDENGDGEIDFEEFMAMMKGIQ